MPDVKQAFTVFHNCQCARFGIAHSSADFISALKELDGTFVATRKLQDSVLVRFQNPSIRDFMQNLLLAGELLPEVIGTLVFFEQAQWFVETLSDEQPRVSSKELVRHAPKVVDALQGLIEAKSCSFVIDKSQPSHGVLRQVANPARRLATVALAVSSQRGRNNDAWMVARMSKLATKVEAGNLSPSSFVGPIKVLESFGWLASESGKHLVLALKQRALAERNDLDDFETVADLVNALPLSFAESELDTVREAYSEFADKYAAECDLNNPDDFREQASRIGNVGELLHVDTGAAQEMLRESAAEIEKEEEPHWEDDDDRGGGGGDPEMCSDRELDAMFGTLGS